MYLHIGNGFVVRHEDIIAVLELDNASQSHITRKFLATAEKSGCVRNAAGDDLPKSVVVCSDNHGQTVWLSLLNSATLRGRRSGADAAK